MNAASPIVFNHNCWSPWAQPNALWKLSQIIVGFARVETAPTVKCCSALDLMKTSLNWAATNNCSWWAFCNFKNLISCRILNILWMLTDLRDAISALEWKFCCIKFRYLSAWSLIDWRFVVNTLFAWNSEYASTVSEGLFACWWGSLLFIKCWSICNTIITKHFAWEVTDTFTAMQDSFLVFSVYLFVNFSEGRRFFIVFVMSSCSFKSSQTTRHKFLEILFFHKLCVCILKS